MKSFFAAFANIITSKVVTTATATTVAITSAFCIWYIVAKTVFKDVAEIASKTDFAVSIVEPESGLYALGFKEETESSEEENTNNTVENQVQEVSNTLANETQEGNNTLTNQTQTNVIEYTTSKEVIDAVEEKLKEDGISAKAFYIDEKTGYLKKFIKAEIGTNYPNLSHKYENVRRS